MAKLFVRILGMVFLLSVTIACEKEEEQIEPTPLIEEISVDCSVIEEAFCTLVNDYRTGIDLNPLDTSGLVALEASEHTDYMIFQGKVSHDNFQERREILMTTAGATKVGEVVAFGYLSAQGFMNGFLNSEEHMEILNNNSYTHFGLSIKQDVEGRYYLTYILIERVDSDF